MPKVTKTISLQYLCNISRKMWRMNLIFCLQINIKGFFILLFLARHAQITQNNKFAISLQYLKKEFIDFFCIQISIKVCYKLIVSFWWGMVKHSWSSQNSKFAMSLQYLKEKLKMKLSFYMQINTLTTPPSFRAGSSYAVLS